MFLKKYATLTDRQWLKKMLATVKTPQQDELTFPGFPSVELQRNFVGSANETALKEAFKFYSLVKTYCKNLDVPLNGNAKLLDFGVGWGRILRFFLRDVATSGLFGADVDPDVLETCRVIGVRGTLFQTEPKGKLPFDDGHFDLVYAYSVFSHLSEDAHLFWVEELARVLRPGGILIVTTEARDFIHFCASLKGKPPETPWHRSLLNAFPDPAGKLREYDSGKFVYAPTGGGNYRDASFYGEAAIPPEYVRRVGTKFLRFHCFIDSRDVLWQALIVMQK
jgi:SAM-dependent methyltransferase